MSDVKKKPAAEVKIAGETVNVYAEGGAEHVQHMAEYINNLINDFNAKKGKAVRGNLLLIYAALELCNAYFKERDNNAALSEKDFMKQYQTEKANHKKTQEKLSETQKRLESAERELAAVQKELDDFINMFDADSGPKN